MHLLRRAYLCLISITILATLHTYLYPVYRGCGFPTKDASLNHPTTLAGKLAKLFGGNNNNAPDNVKAEFRLLALGDPQLEGDTSIWHPEDDAPYRPEALRRRLEEAESLIERLGLIKDAARDTITKALPLQLAAWRKQVDLLGNDYYLAHIYRSLYRYTRPTHVTVVGDLLGSQWIDDKEFEDRASRFWNRVFRYGTRVENFITNKRTDEYLGDERWSRRIINVAGNHDIGYAGDITEERVERFERAFGRANWEIMFHHPMKRTSEESNPTLRIVVLNSMNFDAPAKSSELQGQTYGFLNGVISDSKPVEDSSVGTIVLTHIPLHKEAGVCVDAPYFAFYNEDDGGGIKEQNHLTYDAGRGGLLEGLYGMSGRPDATAGGVGRNGIILTGHDHEGCDVYHHLPEATEENPERRWNATRFEDAAHLVNSSIPGIREVTLRSMMGEFGGYAYMLSVWFDFGANEWKFEINHCHAGVQHFWWATHILILVTAGLGGVMAILDLSSRHGDKPNSKTALRKPAKEKSSREI